MKKILLSLLTLCSVGAIAQSQRMVLVEHFTQASCGPCAGYNPGMQAMIDDPQNAGRLTSIKYQVDWPGYDPMNEHNPADPNTRRTYYGVTGVPNPVVCGNAWNGTGWDQSLIDSLKNTTAPFDITLSHSFNADADKMIVHMKVKANQTTSGNLVAHMVIIEEEINFTFPPGSNGETDFYHVVKKMLPNANGTTLPSTMNAGDSVELTYSWKMANVYDYDQLAVVGFVQNNSGRKVYQAGFDPAVPFMAAHDLNVQPQSLSGMPETNCKGSVTPQFTFRNAGNTAMTSATFKYSINGGAEQTYDWSGLLYFDEVETVTLDELSFAVQPTNTVTVYATTVNGATQDYLVGDTIDVSFDQAIEADATLKLTMLTKNNAATTKWKILDSQGNIVKRNPEGLENNKLYNQDVYMKFDDCFEVVFSHDDGNSSFGGFFDLKDKNGEPILYVSASENLKTGFFTVDPTTTAVEDALAATPEITAFPNPSNGEVFIKAEKNHQVRLLDVTGKTVHSLSLQAGSVTSVGQLPSGIYFLKVDGNKQSVTKIIVN